MKWEEVILEDLCTKITDGAHASPQTVTSGMPMASVKDLTDYGINFDSCRMISNKDYKKLLENDCKPLIDDVLISKDGNSAIDTVCIIKKEEEVVLLSSIAILRPNKGKLHPLFLRHLLSWNFYKQYIKSNFTSGAAIPRVILRNFKKCKISLPPLPIQQRIAAILSAYDDLIENNLRRIELLEQSARELYKEWFVRFKFPGYENVKFVDGLPEGCERKKLGEVVNITMGQSPKSIYYNTENQGLPFHQGVTHFGSRFVIHTTFSTKGNRIAENGDILCSVRAPVGRLNIAPTKLILGRGLSGIRSKSGTQSFVFYQLQSFFFKENIIGTGAIYASVTKNQMLNIEVIQPVKHVIIEFDRIAQSIDKQIYNLTNENQLLKQARDLLLPRLMRGEIEV